MKNILFFLFTLISASLFSQNMQLDWVKTFQAYAGSEVNNKCIDVNTNGDIYATGYYTSNIDFDPDENNELMISNAGMGGSLFISKLNNNGNLVWVKEYSGQNGSGASDIKVVYENGQEYIYVLGFFSGILDIDNDANTANFTTQQNTYDIDIFLLKLDSAGNFIWAKHIGDDSSDVSYEIAVDSTNNVYITGFFNTDLYTFILAEPYLNVTDQAHDMRILKIAPNGTIVWEKVLSGNGYVGANTITIDNNDDIIIAGNYTGTIDFDPSSNVFQMTAYDNYDDIFILKLNNNGNFIWVKQLTGNRDDGAISVKTDQLNNIYIVGYYIQNIDFDPSANTYSAFADDLGGNCSDRFLLKLSNTGDFIWLDQFIKLGLGEININNDKLFVTAYVNQEYTYITATGTHQIPHQTTGNKNIYLEFDNNGVLINYNPLTLGNNSFYFVTYDTAIINSKFYTSGVFRGEIDFDTTNNTYLVSSLETDAFTAKYNFVTSKIKSNNLGVINIYPNPSVNGIFYVSNEQLETLDITVFDTTGKIVLKQACNTQSTQINLSKQAKGIYFVKIDNKNMVVTKKVVVE